MWRQIIPGLFEGTPGREADPEWLAVRVGMCRLPAHTRQSLRFSRFEVTEENAAAVHAVRQFCLDTPPHHFLTLTGEVGRGKTHLAVAALWSWLEAGRGTGLYYQVQELLNELRDSFHRGDTPAILPWVRGCGLLVLDDLGAHSAGTRGGDGPTWAEATLDEVVNHRYLAGLRTLVTLNVVRENLPVRLADRVTEGQVFTLVGKDFRTEKAARRRRAQAAGAASTRQEVAHGYRG